MDHDFIFVSGLELADKVRSLRDDSIVVQRWVARVVVHLDMTHICRFLDTVYLPDIDTVAENVGVLAHRLSVTLEIDCVDFIISNECLEEPDIRQGEHIPSQEL